MFGMHLSCRERGGEDRLREVQRGLLAPTIIGEFCIVRCRLHLP